MSQLGSAIRGVLAAMALAAAAPLDAQDVDGVLAAIGARSIRSVELDLCLPATSEEYVALGKQAVVMLTARTAIAAELPLKSVFVETNGVRVPLQRISRREIVPSEDTDYVEQVSFYLIPIALTKVEGQLAVDFQGERKGFGVANFGADGTYYSSAAPAFVRLDEYDDASEAEPEALAGLLVREYPDFFR